MTDNNDTGDETLENSASIEAKKILDANSPTVEPDSITSKKETENMEVHHHPDLHHKPKKWKEYFLEFLMIFLAVTLGFFAENFREHRVERETEKHTIESLLNCLASDTIQLKNIINLNEQAVIHLDNFNKIKNVDMSNEDAKKQFLIESIQGITTDAFFKTNDGALEQLKSSGMFRLVHKQSIIDSILEYDLINKSTVSQEADYYYIFKETFTSFRQVVNLSFFERYGFI